MKITKRNPIPSEIWIGHCMFCKSEAEADRSEMVDIRNEKSEYTMHSWLQCPVCGDHMFFYPSNIRSTPEK